MCGGPQRCAKRGEEEKTPPSQPSHPQLGPQQHPIPPPPPLQQQAVPPQQRQLAQIIPIRLSPANPSSTTTSSSTDHHVDVPAPSTLSPTTSSSTTVIPVQHHDDTVVDWRHVSFLPFPLGSYVSTEEEHAGETEVAARFNAAMLDMVRNYAGIFTPTRTLQIGHDTVQLCQPMALGRTDDGRPEDIAIPLLITHGGSTQLVMAYQSESQGCWRRYAGRTGMGYFKGNDQHWQNFDSRIQQALDAQLLATAPIPLIGGGGRILRLEDFGISLSDTPGTSIIFTNEERIFASMSEHAAPLELAGENNMPGTIVRYWPARNSAYGDYFSVVVRSSDNHHDYGIAVTRLGIFVQYVQDNSDAGINGVGAPARGVTLDPLNQWVMTPILEYDKEVRMRSRREPQGIAFDPRFRGVIQIEPTGLGVRGGRDLVLNLHSSQLSPFREINFVFEPVCRYLAAGNMNSARIMLERFRTGRLE